MDSAGISVCGLAVAPVKGTRLQAVDEIRLESGGVRENRRFFLIDDAGSMVNSLRLGELQTIVASYSDEDRTLRLELPGGRVLEDEVSLGPAVTSTFYGSSLQAHRVEGPWSEAISEVAGRKLHLVDAGVDGAVDRGALGAATVISRASLERLAAEGAMEGIDSRRFRMLIEIDGVQAHEEDGWVGHRVRIGGAVVDFKGHVGRCAITTRNPDSGVVDVPTLKLLGRYRRDAQATEPIPFGIYGQVLEPGTVRVGDAVALEG